MANTVAQMTPEELQEMITACVEDAVDRRLTEMLGDPDDGLELREEIVEQLKAQQARLAAGDRGRSIEEVRQELGLL